MTGSRRTIIRTFCFIRNYRKLIYLKVFKSVFNVVELLCRDNHYFHRIWNRAS